MSTEYTLAYGTHRSPEDGRCAMEWVAHLAGEPHSDDPACVSPVLRAFCTTFNDSLDDAPRQRLRPFLARTIGTAEDGLDGRRSWMALDWLIRTYTPCWLAAAGMTTAADGLGALPEVTDGPSLRSAIGRLGRVRRDTHRAWSAALGPARPAALTPWAAGRAAAREAAWSSAGAAAWAAARVAVGDMAGDRARAVTRDIAADAAAIVARGARTGSGRTAARANARAALIPTLETLQRSAFGLLDHMLPLIPLVAPIAPDAGQVCDCPLVEA